MNVRSESCDNKSSFDVLCKQPVQSSADDRFAHSKASALYISAFAHIQKNAFCAYFAYGFKVNGVACDGRQIDFVISAVENNALRRAYCKSQRPCDRMVYVDCANLKTAELYGLPRFNRDFLYFVQAVFP